MSIYVANLSYEVTEADLKATFAEYGSVKRVQLSIDRETGRVRGFGFVEMSTEAEEEEEEALDGAEWMGRITSHFTLAAISVAKYTTLYAFTLALHELYVQVRRFLNLYQKFLTNNSGMIRYCLSGVSH
jgi:hypothetical protein